MWYDQNRVAVNCVLLLGVMSVTGTGMDTSRSEQCPQRCTCAVTATVSCVKKKYTYIPPVPSLTSDLEMSFNNLTVIHQDTFQGLEMLVTLRLDFNQIHTLESGAFQYLSQLSVLHLHNNRLKYLEYNTFANLKQLRRLYLNHNQITYLHSNLFYSTTNLHVLDVRANRITRIQNLTFHRLTSLNELHVAENPLVHLSHDAFHQLGSLTELNIASSDLQIVHPDLLVNQTRLVELDLSANNLRTLSAAVFRNLHKLQYLNLSGNPFYCDCHIVSLKTWVDSHYLIMWRQSNSPKCSSPESLADSYLSEVSVANLTCFQGKRTRENATKDIRKVHKYRSKLGRIPYNPLMGWYTAATLTGMLVLFLLFVALDKAKRCFYKWRRERRRMKKEKYQTCSQFDDNMRKLSLDGADSVSMAGHMMTTIVNDDTKYRYVEELKLRTDGLKLSSQCELKPCTSSDVNTFTRDTSHEIVIEVCDHSNGMMKCNNCSKSNLVLNMNETTL